MIKYSPKKIERKWQKYWDEKKINKTDNKSDQPKYYILDMFPYPSGAGLHVGHPKGYIATDVVARMKMMQGYNVLHTMGWDAFGLPAENYAIANKVHPKVATDKNIATFKKQLGKIGFTYDWSREVNTTDPKYYKWTQWTFLQMFKKGLAYESFEPVNWCPVDKTVLANEDLEEGKCERCGSPVERRPMRQWVLRITKYADRMLNDLDKLPKWPEAIKEMQRNWIGRSEGAEIEFPFDIDQPNEGVFASNNEGKMKRMQKLFKVAGLKTILRSPKEIGIKNFEVVEDGKTLAENAEKKAYALAKKTKLPVVADDGGFFIDGAEIDPVTVKRNALNGKDEKSFTIEEIAVKMQKFYQKIAAEHGGQVDAEWRNVLCLASSDGSVSQVEIVRPVILTNKVRGKVDPYLPLRSLYISKATGKYVLEQTEAEEMIELQPFTDGIKEIFSPRIKVFTTRPDTLFGVTYVVLAPENKLVGELKNKIKNWPEVEKYLDGAKKKSDLERTELQKEKTGMKLEGVLVKHPVTGEQIPVWIADYVLASYGTGAVMAVPAHDERDFEFAKKYNLPIKEVVIPKLIDQKNPHVPGKEIVFRDAVIAVVRNPKNNQYLCLKWKKHPWVTFVMGGIEKDENAVEAAIREIREETGYQNVRFVKDLGSAQSEFFAAHKGVNRIAHTRNLLFELENEIKKEISNEESQIHELEWRDDNGIKKSDMTHSEMPLILSGLTGDRKAFTENGILFNSGEFTRLSSEEARKKITEKFGKKQINYKLRDWVFSRQRYWGEPIPIIHCEKCGVVAVPEKDLPVELPKVKDYEPTGTGESPLANIKKWVNVECPKCGGPAKRETNTMPQWAGSSWYYLRYIDPKNTKALVDKKLEKYWSPVDFYVGGAEHATRHLIYARFWHKFLFDIGVVNYEEPFTRLQKVGLIMAEDGRKMSKRWGNVINPDDVILKFGADSLRIYEMFMGPFSQAVAWSTNGIIGARRFLEKVWFMQEKLVDSFEAEKKLLNILHQTIKKVSEDIEDMRFNTAIAKMMELANEMSKAEKISKENFALFVQILAPFAPHFSEELWLILGHKKSIFTEAWPKYDPALAVSETFILAVQINGKVRDTIEVETKITEAGVKELIMKSEKVQKWLEGREPKKIIYVKGKLVSVVV